MSSIHLRGLKRFTDATITSLPATAKLVVLAGPNGSGKSSLFDGLKTWHWYNGGVGGNWDESYGTKAGAASASWTERVRVEFHEPLPAGAEDRKKLIYTRTAFRNEADFNVSRFNRLASPLETSRVSRMIDNDVTVSENYQRLIMQTIDGVYDQSLPDTMTKGEIRDRIIGRVRTSMLSVFPDLVLTGVGGIGGQTGTEGTFYFEKGASPRFLYKNLSAGEKAAFDLILDAVIKSEFFDDTIWCIDEPETHLNTRIQAQLLTALYSLVPDNSQLWLASHSIGFMRQAWELSKADFASVCFLDMEGLDFDSPVTLTPIKPSRDFWSRTLNVALGDLASLVAPERVVLCEGRPPTVGEDAKAAFDAQCYRIIFAAEHPETDFLSVGNSADTANDRLGIGRAIQTIAPGTIVSRVIDRDFRSDAEIALLERQGTRVLSRRHLEAFLFDDEVIAALCAEVEQPQRTPDALRVKSDALTSSVQRGNDPDDVKRASGSIAEGLRRLLSLQGAGSTAEAFARDTMAPLLRPGLTVYAELSECVSGPTEGG
ncbi:AAA family ATPase [Lysobacter korlensis]|uniref:AAA family ATPase n=1 Tax=Lysobacter korlensis TaxID=553636 RepID=A0ABV6RNG5_9GAMM